MRSWIVLAPLATLIATLPSRDARACGGTFCDNTAIPMPVDQTGEDILFIRDGADVEVHIRIQYMGEAERFAWIVPLQGIPEVTVGSEPLFAALSQATAPNWYAQRSYECPDEDPDNWGTDDGGDFTGDDGGIKLDIGGPEIVFQDTVGSFDVVVLQGGTAAEVIDFLTDNDYAQDPESEPILQQYLDEGFLFAAVKLTAAADVDQIHPLTFRFPGDEPCVPIRLTAIAAKEDMGIRAYFLGQERWAPSNYDHVVVNPLRYDWKFGQGIADYTELLSLAVDEAGGRAFATDYAGPSNAVQTWSLWSASWDETAFLEVDPIEAIDLIAQQGLNTHPLIQPLLMQFIPPPDGLDPQDFWNNIAAYADQINQAAWDAPAFAAALAERIIEPGLHAVDLIEAWPHLTRLHTTMSPVEMTIDPTFHTNADLPDVEATVASACQVLCGGDEVYQVDVGAMDAQVCVPSSEQWPDFDMPAALRIEQVPMMGPPQVVADNEEAILAALATQQEGVQCLGAGDGDGDSGSGTDDGTGDEGGSGSGIEGGNDEIGDESGTGPTYDLPYDTSCGCANSAHEAPLAIGLGLLVLGLIAPRRRRQR
jgi:MYXO-CTERM domain-containing protein